MMKKVKNRLVVFLSLCLLLLPNHPVQASEMPLVGDQTDISQATGGAPSILENGINNSTELADEEDSAVPEPEKLLVAKVQAGSSSDEFVEIYNPNGHQVSLSGWRLIFAKDSGSEPLILLAFSEPDYIAAHSFLTIANFNYPLTETGASFPSDHAFTAMNKDGKTYTKNVITQNGAVWIESDDYGVVDLVGWGQTGLFEGASFVGMTNDTIQRCLSETSAMVDSDDNLADFAIYSLMTPKQAVSCPPTAIPSNPNDEEGSGDTSEESPAEENQDSQPQINLCQGIVVSEIGANLADDQKFIELTNNGELEASLEGCQVTTDRSGAKKYKLDSHWLKPGEFTVIYIKDTDLVLNKTTDGAVYLLNSLNDEVDTVSFEALAKDTSWSYVEGEWVATYLVTPGEVNIYQRWQACDDGYFRNELTGRCNKNIEVKLPVPCATNQYRSLETGRCRLVVAKKELMPCRDDQYRSEETNRCRSIASLAAAALKPCRADQYRNLLTNRCKKIASADNTLKPCRDGYERNPETNRCRKLAVASATIADFPVETVKDSAASFVAWWALGGIVGLGLAVGAWEWRKEIRGAISSIANYRKG